MNDAIDRTYDEVRDALMTNDVDFLIDALEGIGMQAQIDGKHYLAAIVDSAALELRRGK